MTITGFAIVLLKYFSLNASKKVDIRAPIHYNIGIHTYTLCNVKSMYADGLFRSAAPFVHIDENT